MLKSAVRWPLDVLKGIKLLIDGNRSTPVIVSVALPLVGGAALAFLIVPVQDSAVKLALFYAGAGAANLPQVEQWVDKEVAPPPKVQDAVHWPRAEDPEVKRHFNHPFFPSRDW